MDSRTLRMKVESSTTSTRNFLCVVLTMARLSNRHDRPCRLRPYELFHGKEELIFLDRLGEEGGRTFLQSAVAMLCAGARSHHHHRNSARGGTLPQLRH